MKRERPTPMVDDATLARFIDADSAEDHPDIDWTGFGAALLSVAPPDVRADLEAAYRNDRRQARADRPGSRLVFRRDDP